MTRRTTGGVARVAALLIGAAAITPAWGGGLFANSRIYLTYSSPYAVAVGDVSGDGRNDVLLTTYYNFDPDNDYRLFVFRQDEAGQLMPPVKYPTRGTYENVPSSVAVGDLNGDGRADVVVGICGLGLEIFYQGDGGVLAPSIFIATPHSCLVRIGHLNGDNRLDIAAIGWQADAVAVFTQGADGTLSAPQTYLAFHGGFDDLKLGDVNGDGRTDIVVMSGQQYQYPNLSLLTQNADGGFTTAFYDMGLGELASGVAIADVNADGRKDVVVTFGGGTWTPPAIAVFYQEPAGTLAMPVFYPSAADYPGPAQAADLDHDGRDDLVVAHSDVGRIGVYPPGAGAPGPETLYEIPYATWTQSHGLALGDINSDGAPDVVLANSNGYLVVQLNQLPVNQPAIADAGPDSTVRQGTSVRLDGTRSSDPDGQIVAYEWRQLSGIPVALAAAMSPIATFTAPALSAGASALLEFELWVIPDAGARKSDRIVITLNQPPLANAGTDQTRVQSSVVTLDGRASTDPNNAIVDYRWRQLSGPAVTLQASSVPGVASFTAPRLKGTASADLVFELVVTDATGDSAADQIAVRIVK
jgi:hypothetical protein